jgi:hypothetical protein
MVKMSLSPRPDWLIKMTSSRRSAAASAAL